MSARLEDLKPGTVVRGLVADDALAVVQTEWRIEVTIEIHASDAASFAEPVRRLVEDNSAALRFEQHGFEPM